MTIWAVSVAGLIVTLVSWLMRRPTILPGGAPTPAEARISEERQALVKDIDAEAAETIRRTNMVSTRMHAAQRQMALAWLALQMDGIREQGGDNRGSFVERFQKVVDGKAQGEPWCVSFVQYLLEQVDQLVLQMGSGTGHVLPKTESSQMLWSQAVMQQSRVPDRGLIAVWRKTPTTGHCGVVVDLLGDGTVVTVEGNTGVGDQREGDGVCIKRRPKGQIPGFQLLGYLRPWA